ncbi:MAG: sugar ABC transporter permease [Salana multivorans]|nr:sugar ABC transporter permease [Salana multivorans]
MTSLATAGERVAPAPGSPRGRRAREVRLGLVRSVPLLPSLALLALFLLGPIVYAIYGSLTNRTLTGPNAANHSFVGFDNYARLFASSDFWTSVVLTVVFLVASAIIGQNVLGLLLAVLMKNGTPTLSRTIAALVVVAWVLPEIVAAFALYAFFASEGTLNLMLDAIGLTGPAWLIAFPMLAVILANVWRGTAFSMMVYSAALSEVPPEINEAAEIDGASAAQRFFRITLPMIRRSISTNLMLTTLQTLGVFTLIWVMTGGGPGFKSATLPILAYQQAFNFAQIGYGTAIAVITLLIGAIFAMVYIKVLKPEVD